jgi:hypothetical protein
VGDIYYVAVHQSGELEELLEKHNIIPKVDEETATQATSS